MHNNQNLVQLEKAQTERLEKEIEYTIKKQVE
jgi:hypothetical protein